MQSFWEYYKHDWELVLLDVYCVMAMIVLSAMLFLGFTQR